MFLRLALILMMMMMMMMIQDLYSALSQGSKRFTTLFVGDFVRLLIKAQKVDVHGLGLSQGILQERGEGCVDTHDSQLPYR